MRRKASSYRYFLAGALLLSAAECWFFSMDLDGRIGQSLGSLMGMSPGAAAANARHSSAEFNTSGASYEGNGTIAEKDDIADAAASLEDEDRSENKGDKIDQTAGLPQAPNEAVSSYGGAPDPTEAQATPMPEGVSSSQEMPQPGSRIDFGAEIPAKSRRGIHGDGPFADPGQIVNSMNQGLIAATVPSPSPGNSFAASEASDAKSSGILSHWVTTPNWDGSRNLGAIAKGVVPAFDLLRKVVFSRTNRFWDRQSRRYERHPENAMARRMPPQSLRQLLGAGVLKPPQGHLVTPDFFHPYDGQRSPDGRPLLLGSLSPREAERIKPPTVNSATRQWRAAESHNSSPHWHRVGTTHYLHNGPLWAVQAGNQWAPMREEEKHWWTLADGNQPLVWHQGHWWWKEGDTWFLLHNGEPWAYRWFEEWQQSGLVNPQSDTRIVYSADERKAAVITPGVDTAVFDLQTGNELRRWINPPKRPRVR